MAHWKNIDYDSFPVAASMAGAKGIAGVIDASGNLAKAGAAAQPAPGYIVAEETATVGRHARVAIPRHGARVAVQIGASVSVGDLLTPEGTTGQFVPATSGDPIWCKAIEAGADGNTITALWAVGAGSVA
jgi:hypothetical protein